MEDLAVGRVFRAARVRRRWRQDDVAAAAGVSRATVSRLERGRLENVQIGTIRAVGGALGIRVSTELRGSGAELDRLLGAHHSAMHEEVARDFAPLPDWTTVPEVTFSFFGERGAIDILAWHAPTRSLLVIELKTELVDIQETVGTLDRKVRLATKIARDRGWEPLTVSVPRRWSRRRALAAPAGGGDLRHVVSLRRSPGERSAPVCAGPASASAASTHARGRSGLRRSPGERYSAALPHGRG
jgi:transcriptional regulator with XRE-family HTH domain